MKKDNILQQFTWEDSDKSMKKDNKRQQFLRNAARKNIKNDNKRQQLKNRVIDNQPLKKYCGKKT